MGEHELVRRIAALLGRDARVPIGIGDDAAVLSALARPAISVDALVEGVHFDRRWLSWEDVGWKGYAAALSDLAAMGAAPRAGLIALVLPPALSDDEVLAIMAGAIDAAREFGAPIAGGNVSRGGELSITSTVIGEAPERPLTRSGARIGDAIFVTGVLGAAALGWRLLARGRTELADRWRRPRPRFDLSPLAHATSAIDVSDGLVADLGHVCEASGVGAIVERAAIPLHPDQRALATSIGEDGYALALGGGEDYELVLTAPQASGVGTRIGTIVEGAGVKVIDERGREVPVEHAGHRHR